MKAKIITIHAYGTEGVYGSYKWLYQTTCQTAKKVIIDDSRMCNASKQKNQRSVTFTKLFVLVFKNAQES